MARSSAIAEYLPYLRRYARALTGSQQAGDAMVLRCLEAIVAEDARLPSDLPPRVALYTALHRHGFTRTRAAGSGGDTAPGRADRTLGQLAARSREALLLTSMEGFDVATVARILDLEVGDVERAIQDALEDIRQQIRTRVLIIEDEPIIALDLRGIVEEMGHEVVAVAATRGEAVELALGHRPGLVLADIRLADGSSGIDAVREILTGFSVPVVFVTAYPERLLTGERPEPTFLVTKPFAPETIRATVGQALLFT
jgi:CheY-like chemotaxis protein